MTDRARGGQPVSDGCGLRPRAEPFLRLDRADWGLIAALTLLAAAIRFHQLGSESLWLDEATTFQWASLPLADLVDRASGKDHPPTWFLLMHAWLGLGSSSEFMLRVPAAVLGIATVPLCYALGRLVAGRRAAVLTGLLVTVSAFQVHYAQEARSYTLVVLFAAIAMLGLIWLVRNPERAVTHPRAWWRSDRAAGIAWIGFALGTLGALATHNMAVFFLVAANAVLGLLMLRLRPRPLRLLPNWLLAHALILAVWAWWWPVLFRQGAHVLDRFWIPEPTAATIIETVSRVYLDGGYGVLSLLLPVCALLGLRALRRQPWTAAALLVLLVVGPLAILAFGVIRPLFVDKVIIWTAIPFFVLAACGIASIRPRPLFLAALAAVLVEGAVKIEGYYDARTKTDWRGLTATLVEAAGPEALVLVVPRWNDRIIEYYLPRLGVPPGRIDFLKQPRRIRMTKLGQALSSDREIWLVLDLDSHAGGKARVGDRADLSELARDGTVRIYRIRPRE